MSAALAAGLADPVFDSQAIFRRLLDALARPGLVQPFGTSLDPPAPLTPELAAVALALADPDAPIWLAARLSASRAVRDYLRFHTGARVTDDPALAAFGLVSDAADLPPFDIFAQGTDEYPDRSTTIVLALPAFGEGVPIRLAGPGIPGEAEVTADLPEDFAAALRANRRLFPRGVDLLLVAPGRAVGIPRSSRVLGEA